MKENSAKSNCLYFDMTKRERDSAIRYILGSIIRGRSEGGFPSNHYTFDEDVNVYLAHLLFAVSLPQYHEMSEAYLSMDTNEVMRWVRATEDRTIRYFIFKVNADHILIHTAIFDDLLKRPQRNIFKRSKKHYRELAKLYYDQAANYHRRIYRKRTGVGEVLEKLSHYFENYQKLLKYVRKEYFHFISNFRDQVFRGFAHEMQTYEKDVLKKQKMDEFLDLYGQWLQSKDPELAKKITNLASDLKDLDPQFQFDMIRNLKFKGGDTDERKCA